MLHMYTFTHKHRMLCKSWTPEKAKARKSRASPTDSSPNTLWQVKRVMAEKEIMEMVDHPCLIGMLSQKWFL